MPYRLKTEEAAPAGVKRVVREQLDRAVRELKSGDLDRGERAHQARKRFKKIRGVLRLVRGSIGDTYRNENHCYRDLGRKLSSLRDARAVLEAFDALMTHWQDQVDTEAFHPLRQYLDRRRRAAESEGDGLDQRVTEVLEEIEEAKSRIDSWPLKEGAASPLDGGFERTYQRGRRAMAIAHKQPGATRFHEWRKRVKYHWYHVRLLRRLWPQIMRPLGDELKRLSDLLGDDHDLAVLREILEARSFDHRDTVKSRKALFGLIRQRQEELRSEARRLGLRLYAERPKRLLQRVEQYEAALALETGKQKTATTVGRVVRSCNRGLGLSRKLSLLCLCSRPVRQLPP